VSWFLEGWEGLFSTQKYGKVMQANEECESRRRTKKLIKKEKADEEQ